MNVNENGKALILQGLRKKKQTKIWLAEKMGMHKSWACIGATTAIPTRPRNLPEYCR